MSKPCVPCCLAKQSNWFTLTLASLKHCFAIKAAAYIAMAMRQDLCRGCAFKLPLLLSRRAATSGIPQSHAWMEPIHGAMARRQSRDSLDPRNFSRILSGLYHLLGTSWASWVVGSR